MKKSRDQQSEAFLATPDIHAAWESDYLNTDMDVFYDDAIAAIAAAVPPESNPRLLDAGCGYAYHSIRLAMAGFQVTGVDFSELALNVAKQRIAKQGFEARVALQHGNLLKLDFPDEAFDVVFTWGVLMHIPDLELALTELARVLKPGGKLVLAENNAHSIDVRVVEPVVRAAKRLLGRPLNERIWSERGVEEWASLSQGGLLVRKSDLRFLNRVLQAMGITKVIQYSSQYTEIYNRLPLRSLKKFVYFLNRRILKLRTAAPYSLGNILIYKKTSS